MEIQDFQHSHPLVPNGEQSNEMKEANCSRCGEVISSPSLSCVECGLYFHKECAEAPSKINHPLHLNHPLVLLPKAPYQVQCACDFCGKKCKLFVYHCPCNLDFHIKCALFSLNLAENKLGELIKDALMSTEDGNRELESANCFGCGEPLSESPFFSLHGRFNLHKKCVELPHEINHPFHNKHPLILQFNSENFSCNICQQKLSRSRRGFIYCCSPCKFALHIKCANLSSQINHPCHRKHPLNLQLINSEKLSCNICQETKPEKPIYCCSPCKIALHIECVSPPSQIAGKSHQQHPFTLIWRLVSLFCSACGRGGNYVPYICTTCNLLVHKNCISLPPIVRVPRHEHPIFHNYFLPENKSENWDCGFCDTEVNTEYGSYHCSDCNFIAHVNCVIGKKDWYYVIEAKDKDHKVDDILELSPNMSINPITSVIEKNEQGEITKMRHFSHEHDLCLSTGKVVEKYCDGCIQPISSSFYNCLQCDFFLHRTCAELPMRKRLWIHRCLRFLILNVGYIFICDFCKSESSGFSYQCNPCSVYYCLQCAKGGYRIIHQGHKHHLFFSRYYVGNCSACGMGDRNLFTCKLCHFNLDVACSELPLIAWHECDEHPLALTYHERNDYSEYHYCDICEKGRDPNLWFYSCSNCEISAHPQCALGRYPFIKPGSFYKAKDHPHPLSFVKKIYYYPGCRKESPCCKCGKLCQDLALECAESTCNYIVHWDCVKPYGFSTSTPLALYKTQTADVVMAHDS